ncbi:unnamed protein product [Effrenium voratum]|uniref:Uncharacterized protein n=1 Tax=Effrenium voratum TaxID=2562239 RepID=A0AA36IT21_9DINO|nr:unnamed protein product [Effrenium voratum]CAJ1393114.1 unnamed protein product [Effrenium voratum]CAJ1418351.1 unnamed protein product [Effrenium voratum]
MMTQNPMNQHLIWRKPPEHVLDPLMVEHLPSNPPAVGDASLQHWINRVRWHADRAILAGQAATKAQDIAEEAAKKVIQMADGVLPDAVNMSAHTARFKTGGDEAAREEGVSAMKSDQEMSRQASQDLPSAEAQRRAANRADMDTMPVQRGLSELTALASWGNLKPQDRLKRRCGRFLGTAEL